MKTLKQIQLKEVSDEKDFFEGFDNNLYYAVLHKNNKESLVYNGKLILENKDFVYILSNGSILYREGNKSYFKAKIEIKIDPEVKIDPRIYNR